MAVTFRDSQGSSSDLTTYTFSSMAIGTASADRVVLAVFHGGATSLRSVSSVTIGGVSATQCALASVNGGVTAIYAAAVPSGTTANVVITWSGGQDRCGCATYTTDDIDSFTPFDTGTDTDNTSPFATTIDVPAGGFILAGMGTHNSAAGSFTWTNLTGDASVKVESNRYFAAGSGNFASAQTNLAVQVAFSGSSGTARAFLAASFSPKPKAVPLIVHHRKQQGMQ